MSDFFGMIGRAWGATADKDGGFENRLWVRISLMALASLSIPLVAVVAVVLRIEEIFYSQRRKTSIHRIVFRAMKKRSL